MVAFVQVRHTYSTAVAFDHSFRGFFQLDEIRDVVGNVLREVFWEVNSVEAQRTLSHQTEHTVFQFARGGNLPMLTQNEIQVHQYRLMIGLHPGGKLGGIFNWSTDAKEDTLDSYYYNAVFLEGYPYVRSNESYTRSGTKTAIAEIHYLFPVYDDWRKRLWIFSTRDLYLDVFAQAGAAWNGKWNNSDNFTKHGFWDRSAGFGIRWSNKLFESIPVDMSLTFARALDRIGEEDGVGYKLNPIDLPLLPKRFAPTRIRFNLGMGFLNSWQ